MVWRSFSNSGRLQKVFDWTPQHSWWVRSRWDRCFIARAASSSSSSSRVLLVTDWCEPRAHVGYYSVFLSPASAGCCRVPCRRRRSGSVIKELEQMCEKARSIRRRAAAAAAAAAVRSAAPPSARRFSFRARAGRAAVRRRRLISLK